MIIFFFLFIVQNFRVIIDELDDHMANAQHEKGNTGYSRDLTEY
jgi:hypothetical protein